MKDIKLSIPLGDNFAKKKVDANLYSFFQLNRYKGINKEGEYIYFCYKDGFKTKASKLLHLKEDSVKNKIKNLIEEDFIKRDCVKLKGYDTFIDVYRITSVDKYVNVSKQLLESLMELNESGIIKLYVYLYNNYNFWRKNNKDYLFSEKELIANSLGTKATNQQDYIIIKKYMKLLIDMNILELAPKKIKKINNNGSNTYYFKAIKVSSQL